MIPRAVNNIYDVDSYEALTGITASKLHVLYYSRIRQNQTVDMFYFRICFI